MKETMTPYIGTKRILATPMSAGQFQSYKTGEDVGEEPPIEGYLVEYLDSPDSNHPNHAHYISWSPKDVFEKAYRMSGNGLTFGEAIEMLKSGFKVAREGWNGKGMFCYLVPGSTFKVNRAPLLGIYEEGTDVNYRPHIDLKTADGSIATWSPSGSDALAEDWVVVE